MRFGCKGSTAKYEIFILAALMGAGGCAMLVSSITIVASLVGNNTGTVYNFRIECFKQNVTYKKDFTLLY